MNHTGKEAHAPKYDRVTPANEAFVANLKRERAQLAEALNELYELLEEYAPSWYSEDQHEKAKAALELLGQADSLPSCSGLSNHRDSAVLSS